MNDQCTCQPCTCAPTCNCAGAQQIETPPQTCACAGVCDCGPGCTCAAS